MESHRSFSAAKLTVMIEQSRDERTTFAMRTMRAPYQLRLAGFPRLPALAFLCLGIIVYRLLNAAVMQVFFNVDEYFNTAEVAHRIAYGYGFMPYDWESNLALRTIVNPLVFSWMFRLVDALHLNGQISYAFAAKLFQACLAGVADIHFVILALKLFAAEKSGFRRRGAVFLSIFCLLSNWFVFCDAPRTRPNTMEMCLFTISLAYFPWNHVRDKIPGVAEQLTAFAPFFAFMAVTCIFRPTALITYIPILIWIAHFTFRNSLKNFVQVVTLACVVALPFLAIMVLCDSWFYNRVVFTPWNFVKSNIIDGKSAAFGNLPAHWYLTSEWWTILSVSMPFALIGLILWLRSASMPNIVPYTVIFVTLIYSLQPRKIDRLMLPLVPLSCLFSGFAMAHITKRIVLKTVLVTMFAVNVLTLVYSGVTVPRGPLAILPVVRDLCRRQDASVDAECSIVFLTKCHPPHIFSYFGMNASVRYLGWELMATAVDGSAVAKDKALFLNLGDFILLSRSADAWMERNEFELEKYVGKTNSSSSRTTVVIMNEDHPKAYDGFIVRHGLTVCQFVSVVH